MADPYIIHDFNWKKYAQPVLPDGTMCSTGLVERTDPVGTYKNTVFAINFPLIPQDQWKDRIKELNAKKMAMKHIRATGNAGQRIPSLNQNPFPYCFPAGTRIRMADGSQKNIESIQLLDDVLSAEGNVRGVKQLHVRNHYGKMAIVKLWGHGHLHLTPNHSVLTKRGYVRADKLIDTDWVCMPRYSPQNVSVIQTAEYITGVKRRVKDVVGVALFPEKLPDKSDTACNHLPDFIELTEGFGKIVGYYLAEGFSKKNAIFWAFSTDEEFTLAADLRRLLKEELGVESTTEQLAHNVTQVCVTGKMWSQLFRELCGSGSLGKRVHPTLMGGPKEFLAAMYDGWVKGDGHVIDKGTRSYLFGASISHDLALNMYDIANFLGMSPVIGKEKPQVNKYAKKRQPVWKVKICLGSTRDSNNYRMQLAEDKMWRRVRRVEMYDYKGKVYNIGVEKDNSYVAEGIGVHNCWAHSPVSALHMQRAISNQPYVPISAFCIAATIKKGRQEGGWAALAMDFLATKGACSQTIWPQQDADYRKHDTSETWANAALHKATSVWADLDLAAYDRKLSYQQFGSLLLSIIPVPADFMWWAHSVCAIGLEIIDTNDIRHEDGKLVNWMQLSEMEKIAWDFTGGIGTRIWNSWGDSHADNGEEVLAGSRGIPDGAVALLSSTASVN